MSSGWFAIIGTIVGAAATWFIGWRNARRERVERQRVTAMQIAAQLRLWLIETVRAFQDHPILYEPDPNQDPGDPYGYFFPAPSDIPPFPFNDALERISSLPSADAQSLFNLIERRLEAERQARVTSWSNDNDEAAELFERLIAEVFLEGLAIYKRLAEQVSWTLDVIHAEAVTEMRERATPPKREPAQDPLL
jgi:hypothetical protein